MKPTGVYTPLLIRWIHRAARQGKSAEQIATRFNTEVTFVKEICRVHGISLSGIELADHVPGKMPVTEISTIGVRIANASLTRFEQEAARRGTSATLLAGEILNLIAADELFAAVLDA